MKKILLALILLVLPTLSRAQEYTANTWGSWASVTSQVDWTFPYNSRSITLINGSTNVICASFGKTAIISASCTDTANDVFQVGQNSFITFENFVRPSVHIRAPGAAASPVSVMVAY